MSAWRNSIRKHGRWLKQYEAAGKAREARRKVYLRNKGCGKQVYDTRVAALRAMAVIAARRSEQEPLEKSAYYCEVCRAWHLTSH